MKFCKREERYMCAEKQGAAKITWLRLTGKL